MAISISPTPNAWPLFDSGMRDVSALPSFVFGDPLPAVSPLKVPAGAYLEISGNPLGLMISHDGLTYFHARKGDVFPADANGEIYLMRASSYGSGYARILAWPEASAGLRAALGRAAPAGVVPSYGSGPLAKTATITSGAAGSFVIATPGVYLVTVTGCDMVRELGGDLPNGYTAHEYLAAGTYVFDSVNASDSGRVTATYVSEWREVMPV